MQTHKTSYNYTKIRVVGSYYESTCTRSLPVLLFELFLSIVKLRI